MANKQTEASKRWADKVGYVSKSYRLKKDVIERFKNACELSGESQASVLTRMMAEYSGNIEGKNR